MADILLHEAVCGQSSHVLLILDSSIVQVFEVTDCSVSSSLSRKAEQQSIIVLHTKLFTRQWHCSTISVQIV